MTAKFIVADVFDGLATLPDGSVDVVVTSPPFLALRSYLPADHPDKGKEIGSEATPAEFIDTLLKVTAELRRVLAPHGSICVELGDTYAGGGGENHLYERPIDKPSGLGGRAGFGTLAAPARSVAGWPLAKSRTLIPSLYQIALAYGINPLTGLPSPAGQWRIRNIVTWARSNPPVGKLFDKWRPATSDLIIACTSGKRYWDDLATRKPHQYPDMPRTMRKRQGVTTDLNNANHDGNLELVDKTGALNPAGAPLLDYWVIPPGGYTGAHYAVFPEELVVPCVTCGEPSRRIVEPTEEYANRANAGKDFLKWSTRTDVDRATGGMSKTADNERPNSSFISKGWTDCGCCGNGATEFNQCGDLKHWRPGLVLDPFAGSGTTLAVATGHGHDAIGIDIDSRNAELARDRVGPFFFEKVDLPVPTP